MVDGAQSTHPGVFLESLAVAVSSLASAGFLVFVPLCCEDCLADLSLGLGWKARKAGSHLV